MRFCPGCDNMLLVKRKGKEQDKKKRKKILSCSSCGYEAPFEEGKDKTDFTISEKITHDGKDKTAIITISTKGNRISEEDREANEWLFENGD